MNVVDNGSQCGMRLTCVTSGLRILLNELRPCRAKVSICATAERDRLANAVDVVSLFVFPNVVVGTAKNDFNCSDEYPRTTQNTFPQPGVSAYMPPNPPPATPTYQIVGFTNDYRTSRVATTLNPDSDIVKALYGVSGCKGLKAVGGEGDYFAGAIYAAQNALTGEQQARPGSQNVIVLISDGYAGAIRRKMAEGATDSGVYPSWINECGQAIIAANAASSSGTRVFSVAYGGDSTRKCPTDNSGAYKGYSSCQTMAAIASSPAYFYSAPMVFFGTQGPYLTPCDSAAHPITYMNRIFLEIGRSIKAAKAAPMRRSSLSQ